MLKKILAFILMLYAAVAFAAVDANKGTAAELDGVKGIGPAISTKIVEERKKAPFKDWDDLIARVKGIGDKSAAKLSEGGLTVNGAEYKGAPAASTPKKETKAAAPTAAAPKAEEKKPAASAPAMKEEKKDAKAEAKAKKEADKKAKEEEKAKKAEEKKAKKEAAKAKPAASAASAKK